MQTSISNTYKKYNAIAEQADRDMSYLFFDPNNPNNETSDQTDRRPRIRPTIGDGGASNGLVANTAATISYWQMAQQLNNMYIFWKYGANPVPMAQKIRDQWSWIQYLYTPAQLAGDGTDGTINISDDAVWKACTLMQIHEVTGDPKALAYLGEMIAATTSRFDDPNPANAKKFAYGNTPGIPGVVASRAFASSQYGILYAASNDAGSTSTFGTISTSYEAGLAICALYVYEQTSYGYLQYALNTYNWIHSSLRTPAPADSSRKAQALYETELVLRSSGDDKSSSAYLTPRNAFYGKPIRGTDSTYINGAFMMAVLAARLYRITGDSNYQAECNAIAAAISSPQGYGRTVNSKLLIQNTRDPWTDGFFAPQYAAEVLSLSSVDTANVCRQAFLNTAYYIADNQRENSYYAADWAGPETNTPGDNTTSWQNNYSKNPGQQAGYQQIMTSSSTVSMLQAGWIIGMSGAVS